MHFNVANTAWAQGSRLGSKGGTQRPTGYLSYCDSSMLRAEICVMGRQPESCVKL